MGTTKTNKQLAQEMRNRIQERATKIASPHDPGGFCSGGGIVIVVGETPDSYDAGTIEPFIYPIFNEASVNVKSQSYGDVYTPNIVMMKIANAMECYKHGKGMLSGTCPEIAKCSERTGMVNYLGAMMAIIKKHGVVVRTVWWGASGATAKKDLFCAGWGLGALKEAFPEQNGYTIEAPDHGHIICAGLAYDIAKWCSSDEKHTPLLIGPNIHEGCLIDEYLQAQGIYPAFTDKQVAESASRLSLAATLNQKQKSADIRHLTTAIQQRQNLRSKANKEPDSIIVFGRKNLANIVKDALNTSSLFNELPLRSIDENGLNMVG